MNTKQPLEMIPSPTPSEGEMVAVLQAKGWRVEPPLIIASPWQILGVFALVYSLPLGIGLIATVLDYFGFIPGQWP